MVNATRQLMVVRISVPLVLCLLVDQESSTALYTQIRAPLIMRIIPTLAPQKLPASIEI